MVVALIIGAPGTQASHTNDATLRATLNGAYRNGSVFIAGATVLYSPLFSDKLMNLSLPLTNQALRGQTVSVTPAIRAEALAEIRKATAVQRLAERYEPSVVVARTSLRADRASSDRGRIARALGLDATASMLSAISSLIRSADIKIQALTEWASGCFLPPHKCTAPSPRPSGDASRRRANSAIALLKTAKARLS